jgi:3D-(3,5/4)-trihydroxycyclohexane-1,2-dione acylhydrolase (decyclizing)
MGATAVKVGSIAELEDHLARAKGATKPYVIVIDTDPYPSTEAGGTWWEVGIPEVSPRAEVNAARKAFETNRKTQRAF